MDSIRQMTSSTAILFNLTGPYRFYGEPVVSACIETRTHYIDICGEPQFIENMFLKYNDQATDAGVVVMHACGFDSIPAELGHLLAEAKSGHISVNKIDMYLSVKRHSEAIPMCFHSTTFQAAVYSISDYSKLKAIRKHISEKYQISRPVNDGKKKKMIGAFPSWSDLYKCYYMVFAGADSAIIQFNQLHSTHVKREVRTFPWPKFHAYMLLSSSSIGVLIFLVFGFVVKFLCNFSFSRRIMCQFPELFTNNTFTKKGPTTEQMNNQYFTSEFVVSDDDDVVRSKIKLTGPDPGYIGTSYLLLAIAKVFSNHQSTFPRGVITPGIGLRCSNKVDEFVDELESTGQFRLEMNDIKY